MVVNGKMGVAVKSLISRYCSMVKWSRRELRPKVHDLVLKAEYHQKFLGRSSPASISSRIPACAACLAHRRHRRCFCCIFRDIEPNHFTLCRKAQIITVTFLCLSLFIRLARLRSSSICKRSSVYLTKHKSNKMAAKKFFYPSDRPTPAMSLSRTSRACMVCSIVQTQKVRGPGHRSSRH